MKQALALASVVAAAFLIGLVACLLLIAQESQLAVGQQPNGSGPMASSSSSRMRSDPTAIGMKQTEVPDLPALVGLTLDQALASIGHGATVADTRELTGADGSPSTWTTIALAAERSDPQTGAPTVYLGIDAGGRVRQASYSVSLESLGYSSDLSFRQAVARVHVVERTLADAGIEVEEGSASLPLDRTAYSTYLDDGRTLERELATFGGGAEADGMPLAWSAELEYDYSAAIDSGNLADAVHLITVGIDAEL